MHPCHNTNFHTSLNTTCIHVTIPTSIPLSTPRASISQYQLPYLSQHHMHPYHNTNFHTSLNTTCIHVTIPTSIPLSRLHASISQYQLPYHAQHHLHPCHNTNLLTSSAPLAYTSSSCKGMGSVRALQITHRERVLCARKYNQRMRLINTKCVYHSQDSTLSAL